MPRLTAIALGGVLGSLARFAVAQPFGPWTALDWPFATLIVNVVGCLLIGIIASSGPIERGPLWLRPFLITGVLGPQSNAHGPNEFLHIDFAKKVTVATAMVVAAVR